MVEDFLENTGTYAAHMGFIGKKDWCNIEKIMASIWTHVKRSSRPLNLACHYRMEPHSLSWCPKMFHGWWDTQWIGDVLGKSPPETMDFTSKYPLIHQLILPYGGVRWILPMFPTMVDFTIKYGGVSSFNFPLRQSMAIHWWQQMHQQMH